MIGFGCNLCDFLCNRKITVKKHILTHIRHSKSIKPKTKVIKKERKPPVQSNSEENGVLIPCDQMSSTFTMESILEPINCEQQTPSCSMSQLQHNDQTGREGKSISISLESIIRDEIGDIFQEINPIVEDGPIIEVAQPAPYEDGLLAIDFNETVFDDNSVAIDLDSDSDNNRDDNDNDHDFVADDVIDLDDASDEEEYIEKKKKKRKRQKNNNPETAVGPSVKIEPKSIINKVVPLISTEEIQVKLEQDECDVEVDPNNNLIKCIKPIVV